MARNPLLGISCFTVFSCCTLCCPTSAIRVEPLDCPFFVLPLTRLCFGSILPCGYGDVFPSLSHNPIPIYSPLSTSQHHRCPAQVSIHFQSLHLPHMSCVSPSLPPILPPPPLFSSQVNSTGVMPIIFSSSLTQAPYALARFTGSAALQTTASALYPGGMSAPHEGNDIIWALAALYQCHSITTASALYPGGVYSNQ